MTLVDRDEESHTPHPLYRCGRCAALLFEHECRAHECEVLTAADYAAQRKQTQQEAQWPRP